MKWHLMDEEHTAQRSTAHAANCYQKRHTVVELKCTNNNVVQLVAVIAFSLDL